MKQYYWAENLENYKSDNEPDFDQIIEIKRLNFFIGRNNAGKSRFLRSLFSSKNQYQDFNTINPKKILKELHLILNQQPENVIIKNNTRSSSYLGQLTSLINEILEKPFFPTKDFHNVLLSHLSRLNGFYFSHDPEYLPKLLENLDSEIQKFNQIEVFISKSYIPILRGMRPTSDQESSTPYIDRTIKDYFTIDNKEVTTSTDVISGECLFSELTRCLLGELHERQIIREYEQKLSQYFFDNQTISLIPKYNSDVVYIKIGEDKQFPIYQLGDGLQQAIILTYEAFIQKDRVHTFFIEEPELHMHAGMVRQLMNFYLNETKHYYFFTTHSNHLLDMVDESDDVIIQKFSKNPDSSFQINRCDKDRDLLASLGVKPSSVYLANCTIWVEGITDRLYITRACPHFALHQINMQAM